MKIFGLVGYPISHSFSPRYFAEKFEREGITNATYRLFPLPDIRRFPELFLDYPDICGLNVTIPYKQLILSYLDETAETARAVGAVNTIVRTNTGRLVGHNTDVWGFEQSLLAWLKNNEAENDLFAFILGTGGASLAVQWVLNRWAIPYVPVSRMARPGRLLYSELPAFLTNRARKRILWINTTPLGSWPDLNSCPDIPFELVNDKHLMFDLVYNPAETLLLQKAAEKGAVVKNGLEMLYLQADRAWQLWHPD